MASLRRLPGSRFWIACYTGKDGKRRQRSTKMTDRTKAKKVADSYEAAYRRTQTETQVRRVMADIFQDVHGESLSHHTLDQWFDRWLERIKPEVDDSTHVCYSGMARLARKFAPEMCGKMLDRVETKHVLEFRARLVAERSRRTTNQNLKVLRQCLKSAWMEGLIPENPAARVANVRAEHREEDGWRRPFTLEELRKVLAAADDEWRGMIFAGLYTAGQRLGDIATMTASQVDLTARIVRFSTDKTGRPVIVPIVDPWMADLKKRVEGLPPNGRLFPGAFKRFEEGKRNVGRISNTFRRLLARCGLATKSNRARPGAIPGRRRINPLSFHSFRHTATSLLKNAGVSDAVVMDIVGHESEAVSRNYTHIDDTTKRAALEKLPTL